MRPFLISACLVVISCASPDSNGKFPEFTGDYLGQKLPGEVPELFAPGIISTGLHTRDFAMTPDGDEIYFCANVGSFSYSAIFVCRRLHGVWAEPEVTSFSGDPAVMDIEPAISPDGSRFYFMSTRGDSTIGAEPGNQDIWVMDREGDAWSQPYNLGPPVNSELAEYFPSVTRDGSLYFTRELGDPARSGIYRARYEDGKYLEPERLPDLVNAGRARFNATVAADESFLIVPIFGLEDSYGATDYYVFFRDEDDQWTGPFHFDERVNSDNPLEYSAALSPDGRYLFFMSGRMLDAPKQLDWRGMQRMHGEPGNGLPGIWWISASIIDELRPVTE
jgi:hypothetical protein